MKFSTRKSNTEVFFFSNRVKPPLSLFPPPKHTFHRQQHLTQQQHSPASSPSPTTAASTLTRIATAPSCFPSTLTHGILPLYLAELRTSTVTRTGSSHMLRT